MHINMELHLLIFLPVISKAKQKAFSVNGNIGIVVQVKPHVGNMCTLHVGLYLHLHCCFVQTCIFEWILER